MKVDMAVNLKSISTTSVTLSYAYSDTALDTISSTSNIFECQRISPNATKYIYIVVTPTSTSIPSTFSSSVVFYQGEAGTLDIIANGEILSSQTIVKGQLVNEPQAPTAPSGYEFGGWYLDANCTLKASFPMRNQGVVVYAKLEKPANLPSDWLAYDSTTKTYYVIKGTSTLPSELVIPSTYNNGVNGLANVTHFADGNISLSDAEYYGLFMNQSSLTSVFLPDTITTINYGAFASTPALVSINIPSSVLTIEAYAFAACNSLTNIDFSKATNLQIMEDNCLYSCFSLAEVNLCGCQSLTAMPYLGYNGTLTTIYIPRSVIYIKPTTFGSFSYQSLSLIYFEDPTGWYYTSNSDYTGGTPLDLSDSSANATYFTSTYVNYYWYKK